MATWQYPIYVFPNREVEKLFGNTSKIELDTLLEMAEGLWVGFMKKDWLICDFEKILPLSQRKKERIMFWTSENNDINLFFGDNELEACEIRVSLWDGYQEIIHSLSEIFLKYELGIHDGKSYMPRPDTAAILKSAESSSAFRFVQNPRQFIHDIAEHWLER